MNIQISFRKLESSDALTEYVNEKFSTLEKVFSSIRNIKVTLTVSGNKSRGDGFNCDAKVEIPKKKLYASESAGDMHAAIDLTVPKLKQQLEKHLTKLNKR